MNLNRHLTGEKAHTLGGHFIKDLLYHINLNKVVAGAQGANLTAAALLGPLADLASIGAFQAR